MKEIIEKIKEAEFVLIGLGEEFDNKRALDRIPEYKDGLNTILESEEAWLTPAYVDYTACNESVERACFQLEKALKGKNYFIVSTSTNPVINRVPWRENCLVMPCGGTHFLQCEKGCKETLRETTEEDMIKIKGIFGTKKDLIGYCNSFSQDKTFGECPICGAPLIFNNVYTMQYNELGYLEQWQRYTKWLMGTLNKSIFVLELGVGWQAPSVIRSPFEKIAYFNKKASFYRINEKLYQLTEELKDKGVSVPENAIDWLLKL